MGVHDFSPRASVVWHGEPNSAQWYFIVGNDANKNDVTR